MKADYAKLEKNHAYLRGKLEQLEHDVEQTRETRRRLEQIVEQQNIMINMLQIFTCKAAVSLPTYIVIHTYIVIKLFGTLVNQYIKGIEFLVNPKNSQVTKNVLNTYNKTVLEFQRSYNNKVSIFLERY
jgi:hypothetical protein